MRTLVIVTGGTFDKEYDELRGTLSFHKTHLPEMLKLGRCRLKTRVVELMLKDSLCMTAGDRKRRCQHRPVRTTKQHVSA